MLYQSGVKKPFWGEALLTATYLKNILPTSAVPDITPFEAWHKKRPAIAHLRPVGCQAFIHVPKTKRDKLDPRSKQGILLGYTSHREYRLLCEGQVIRSRDVIFREDIFPMKEKPSEAASDNFNTAKIDQAPCTNSDVSKPNDELLDSNDEYSFNKDNSVNTDSLRRSCRERKPKRDPDFVYNETGIREESPDRSFLIQEEPASYEEAICSNEKDNWKAAMDEEWQSLIENHTWELTELPQDRKAIGSKWVYKIKRDAQGKFVKFKARVVAQGYAQQQGIDFEDTYASVARTTSIRFLLALMAIYDLEAQHLDVRRHS